MWISIGKSRKELKWKNTEITWGKFVDKLRVRIETDETFDEYIKLKKPQQDEIKDVGGFVGGTIFGGRRKAGSVTSRWILTLDIDRVDVGTDFVDNYDLLLGHVSSVIYSTHSHSPEKPRYRLIIQLDQEVQPDAYEAIGRRVAEWVGIEQFDPTTFQAERLMYWPSSSKGAQFVMREFRGSPLDTEMVLGTYNDWSDSSEWPVSNAAQDAIKRGIKKQGDPLEKSGIIGVFCRVYGIAEAIEKYLSDVYVETGHDDRYTYVHGSTSAGVVVYEDKFSFSHHGTDPTSMKLCNAFDLVRIHLYGDLDKDSSDEVPSNKLPSFLKMQELVSKDKQVKRLMLTEQINSAKSDFGDNSGGLGSGSINAQGALEDLKDDDEDESWVDQLETDRHGKCLSTINNCILVLENDSMVKDSIRYNDFDKRITLSRNLPWRKIGKYMDVMTDSDDAAFRNYFEVIYKITGESKIRDAIDIVSRKHSYHPVKEYLDGVKWDGEERLERVIINYLGADDTDYVKQVTTKSLVAAVARVKEPGIKFDHILTFSGEEGAGKSYLLSKLGMSWYSDSFGSLQSNAAVEQVQGVWIMEVGELSGFKRAEGEAIKLFLSKREDRFRVAYGRRVDVFPRQCVFFGTTNEDMFLKDQNGNRRFWPISIHPKRAEYDVFTELTQEVVDQIWAEALELYKAGEKLFLSKEMESVARKIQEHFKEQDERSGIIYTYLDMPVPDNWETMNVYDRRSYIQGDELTPIGHKIRDKISVPEIWTECLGNQIKDMTHFQTKFIRDIMNSHSEWEKKMIRSSGYGTQRGYARKMLQKHI